MTLCSGGTADVATEGSGPTNVQRPPPFDGKSTWEAYHAQFSLLADLDGWTEQRKAAYLAISLRQGRIQTGSMGSNEPRFLISCLVLSLYSSVKSTLHRTPHAFS